MYDAAASLHPLTPTGAQVSGIAHAVLMLHVTIDHVGESVEAAVWMRRETRNILIRIITAEIIQHQERIIIAQSRCADSAMHRNACAFSRRHRGDESCGVQLCVHYVLLSILQSTKTSVLNALSLLPINI